MSRDEKSHSLRHLGHTRYFTIPRTFPLHSYSPQSTHSTTGATVTLRCQVALFLTRERGAYYLLVLSSRYASIDAHIPTTIECEILIYPAQKNRNPFRDHRSLKCKTDRRTISEKKKGIRTGGFYVRAVPPNAHNLSTVANILLCEFLTAAVNGIPPAALWQRQAQCPRK